MDKNIKIKWIDPARMYLTLDKYMSGKFMPLFKWIMLISLVVFAVPYLIVLLFGLLYAATGFMVNGVRHGLTGQNNVKFGVCVLPA